MISLRIFIVLLPLIILSCNNDNISLPEPPNITTDTSSIKYLALGDSYTIGQNVAANERFPVQLVDSLKSANYKMQDAKIIAQTGWTTGVLQNAITNENITDTFDLVSLLIGVNNQYQGRSIEEYRIEFRALLEQAIGFAGDNKDNVFVLSIPDYSVTPFSANANRQQIAEEIDAFNAVNLEISDSLKVSYFDITPISRQAENDSALIANDGLHPSKKMYRLWIELILSEVKNKLK